MRRHTAVTFIRYSRFVGNNSPTIDRIMVNNQEEFIMKKSLVIGAATLAITAMVGAGFGSASSQDIKDEVTPTVTSTPAVEVTAEERAVLEKEALEVKGTPVLKSTEATATVKSTPAKRATAEEIAKFEAESKATPSVGEFTPSTEASKK